ncbi:MAG: asparagine synthetase B, partial [Candidatus Staskawiczbacteria bacterium]|nr:asparagine synthetase B [Candidatus Staskawiczbacteria bacterium]
MCGIVGKLYFNKEMAVEPELISRMADVLKHRGPDDEGIFIYKNVALGFSRLSIIDLSAAGHQPMCNEDETVWSVFNGEIYNFMDLRVILEKKGHRFKSHCDSEVLIHAYEEYGTECVKQFNGMFAFAVWDKKKQQLFCGRDRTGEKPFFYYHDSGKFVFASELKAILQDGTINRNIDPDALNAYFSYMYIPEAHSVFRAIK